MEIFKIVGLIRTLLDRLFHLSISLASKVALLQRNNVRASRFLIQAECWPMGCLANYWRKILATCNLGHLLDMTMGTRLLKLAYTTVEYALAACEGFARPATN